MIGYVILSAKTLLYILSAVIHFFLAIIYWYGYFRIKTSRIIMALSIYFTSQALFFFATSFLPLFRHIDPGVYLFLTSYLFIFVLPIIVSAALFASASLDTHEVRKEVKNIQSQRGGDVL